MVKYLAITIVFLVLLFVVSRSLVKFRRTGKRGGICITDSLRIGSDSFIYIVEAMGKRYLVAQNKNAIRLLDSLPEVSDLVPSRDAASALKDSFQAVLDAKFDSGQKVGTEVGVKIGAETVPNAVLHSERNPEGGSNLEGVSNHEDISKSEYVPADVSECVLNGVSPRASEEICSSEKFPEEVRREIPEDEDAPNEADETRSGQMKRLGDGV